FEPSCRYKHSVGPDLGGQSEVENIFWYATHGGQTLDLTAEQRYWGHVSYSCGKNSCTLRIMDLKVSSWTDYHFSLRTKSNYQTYGKEPAVTLSVTGEINTYIKVTRYSKTPKCYNRCSSAHRSYIWYKNGQKTGDNTVYFSGSFSRSDSVSCALKGYEDFPSPSVFLLITVNFLFSPEDAPLNISVSVSPSAEMVEGSSVNLSCSSDANPAANITWYKEGEDSPKASGQIFTITDLRPEHSGNYSCEVQNKRGRRRSTLNLTVSSIGFIGWLICWSILLSRRKTQPSEPAERPGSKAEVRKRSESCFLPVT
uniref:Ig-like domain-containing protein n=1 Tax=Echeneis naucrates TaxID=173247 RepID=A0A665UE08_ECHNA